MSIKVLMQNRVDMFEKKGGDLILMIKYKEELEKKGIEVTISNKTDEDINEYDLIHLFNITRIHETYTQFLNAKAQGKKIIISPIYHSVKEVERFDKQGQIMILKAFGKLSSNYYDREQIKNIFRFIKDKSERESIKEVLKLGFRNAQKIVLEGSDLWLLQALEEGQTIGEELQVRNNYMIAYNGVNVEDENQKNINVYEEYGLKDYVLCVGRIEPRKNQLSLLRALQNERMPILCIGSVNRNYSTPFTGEYAREFEKIVNDRQNVHWMQEIPHNELGSFYKASKVHVNPSWFEVVSLINLEAAAYGTNVVLSDVGYQKDFFQKEAFYCDPSDIDSIKNAVLQAYNAPKDKRL